MSKTITITIRETTWTAIASALDVLDVEKVKYSVTGVEADEPEEHVAAESAPKPAAPPKAKRVRHRAKRASKVKPTPQPPKPIAASAPKAHVSPEEVDRIVLGRIVNKPGIASKDLHRETDAFSKDQKGRAAQRLVTQGLVDTRGTTRGASKFWPTPKGTAAHKPTPPAPKAPEPEETPESLRFQPQGDGTAIRKGRSRPEPTPAPEPASKAVPPHKRKKAEPTA